MTKSATENTVLTPIEGTRVRVKDEDGLIGRGYAGIVLKQLFDDDTRVRVRLDKLQSTVVGYKPDSLTEIGG